MVSPIEGEEFRTPPPPPHIFWDISLYLSKGGEEQTVIFGNDIVYINQCMILTCLCQRKSETFRHWRRLSISSGDSLSFSGCSLRKDVSVARIAKEDNFLSFLLICSVDDEESEDSADTLSNLLFCFNWWILPGLDKKDFQIGFFTGQHKNWQKSSSSWVNFSERTWLYRMIFRQCGKLRINLSYS